MIDCELPTEGRNPRTLDVDTLPTLEVLRLINTEDATVPMVVASVLNEVARLVDISVESLRAGLGSDFALLEWDCDHMVPLAKPAETAALIRDHAS